MTADRVHQVPAPKPLWVALDHFDRVAFIGISPAVRISPIGVMRSNPRHRSTVFVISSYPQLARRSLRLARLGRELTRTARCLTARRFEVGDLASCCGSARCARCARLRRFAYAPGRRQRTAWGENKISRVPSMRPGLPICGVSFRARIFSYSLRMVGCR